MTNPSLDDAWTRAPTRLTLTPLDDLFARRRRSASRAGPADVSGITFDWSKTHLDARARRGLRRAGRGGGLCGQARRPVRGRHRQRQRGPRRDPCRRARAGRGRRQCLRRRCATRGCAAWSTRSRAGRSARSTAILHIGIGGSALGPDLVIDALGRDADRYDVRVLANIDGEAFDEAVDRARPGDDAGRRRVEDLHHHRDADQPRRRDRVAARGRGRGSPRPADRGHRRARRGARLSASTRPASCRSAKASAGATACGRRSACRSRWRSAGARIEELLEGAGEMDRHVRLRPTTMSR